MSVWSAGGLVSLSKGRSVVAGAAVIVAAAVADTFRFSTQFSRLCQQSKQNRLVILNTTEARL